MEKAKSFLDKGTLETQFKENKASLETIYYRASGYVVNDASLIYRGDSFEVLTPKRVNTSVAPHTAGYITSMTHVALWQEDKRIIKSGGYPVAHMTDCIVAIVPKDYESPNDGVELGQWDTEVLDEFDISGPKSYRKVVNGRVSVKWAGFPQKALKGNEDIYWSLKQGNPESFEQWGKLRDRSLVILRIEKSFLNEYNSGIEDSWGFIHPLKTSSIKE